MTVISHNFAKLPAAKFKNDPVAARLSRRPLSAMRSRLIVWLRNDLREPGLLALVEALRGNTTLRELRLNHQKFTISTPVEEALHEILHQRHNTVTSPEPHTVPAPPF